MEEIPSRYSNRNYSLPIADRKDKIERDRRKTRDDILLLMSCEWNMSSYILEVVLLFGSYYYDDLPFFWRIFLVITIIHIVEFVLMRHGLRNFHQMHYMYYWLKLLFGCVTTNYDGGLFLVFVVFTFRSPLFVEKGQRWSAYFLASVDFFLYFLSFLSRLGVIFWLIALLETFFEMNIFLTTLSNITCTISSNQLSRKFVHFFVPCQLFFDTSMILHWKRVYKKCLLDLEKAILEKERGQENFTANFSKSLTSSFSGITPILQKLEEQKDLWGEDERYYVKTVSFFADVILNHVNSLNDFRDFQSGKFRLAEEPYNLRELIVTVIRTQLYELKMKRKEGVTIDVDRVEFKNIPAGNVIGDKVRMYQIFTSLITNSIKYTDEGEIGLNIYFDKMIPGLVFICEDEGVGVAVEKLQLLGQNFSDINNDSAGRRNFGVGLYITKGLVSAMGGRIEFRSDGVGKGMMVEVELPLKICDENSKEENKSKETEKEGNVESVKHKIQPQQKKQKEEEEENEGEEEEEENPKKFVKKYYSRKSIEQILYNDTSFHILVLSNDEMTQDFLEKTIKKFSPSNVTTFAENGMRAYLTVKFRGYKPDLIFTDEVLPFMSGTEFVKKIVSERVIDEDKNLCSSYLITPKGKMGISLEDVRMFCDPNGEYRFREVLKLNRVSYENDNPSSPYEHFLDSKGFYSSEDSNESLIRHAIVDSYFRKFYPNSELVVLEEEQEQEEQEEEEECFDCAMCSSEKVDEDGTKTITTIVTRARRFLVTDGKTFFLYSIPVPILTFLFILHDSVVENTPYSPKSNLLLLCFLITFRFLFGVIFEVFFASSIIFNVTVSELLISICISCFRNSNRINTLSVFYKLTFLFPNIEDSRSVILSSVFLLVYLTLEITDMIFPFYEEDDGVIWLSEGSMLVFFFFWINQLRNNKDKLGEENTQGVNQLSLLEVERIEYLSIISHELLPPFTAFTYFWKKLLKSIICGSPEEEEEKRIWKMNDFQLVKENINEIKKNIFNLVWLCQHENSIMRVSPSEFSLEKELMRAVNKQVALRKKKLVKCSVEIHNRMKEIVGKEDEFEVMVQLDLKYLVSIVVNMLSNAFEYTRKGEIKVTIEMGLPSQLGLAWFEYQSGMAGYLGDVLPLPWTTMNDYHLRIRVTDDGVGMSPGMQRRLFHQYSLVDMEGGDGIPRLAIGMFCSYQIAKEMKGNIRILKSTLSEKNNDNGGGTTIEFSCPLRKIYLLHTKEFQKRASKIQRKRRSHKQSKLSKKVENGRNTFSSGYPSKEDEQKFPEIVRDEDEEVNIYSEVMPNRHRSKSKGMKIIHPKKRGSSPSQASHHQPTFNRLTQTDDGGGQVYVGDGLDLYARRKIKVFVMDDCRIVLDRIHEILMNFGYLPDNVVCCRTETDGYHAYRTLGPFDISFIDVNLTRMSGFQFLDMVIKKMNDIRFTRKRSNVLRNKNGKSKKFFQIKKKNTSPDNGLRILLSGDTMYKADELVRYNFKGLLQKPFSKRDVARCLHKLVEKENSYSNSLTPCVYSRKLRVKESNIFM